MTELTLKISGSLIDPEGLDALVSAIHHAPIPPGEVTVVHGGGPQLDAALSRLDEPDRRHQGLRITSRAQANVVQLVLDRVGEALADGLTTRGVDAVHLPSLQNRLVAKVKRADDGTDLGRVGTPVAFRTEPPVPPGAVPVVTPVGTDGSGPLNVNADEAAAAIAAANGSQALVLATDVPGVLDAAGQPIEHLGPAAVAQLVDEGTAVEGMLPKLDAALSAIDDGVATAHVAPLTTGLVADVLEGTGPGTCIASKAEVPA